MQNQQSDVEETSKYGATIDNIGDNAGIDVSSRAKHVHESAVEVSVYFIIVFSILSNMHRLNILCLQLAKEDVETSVQQNEVMQSQSQAKRQKVL